MFLEIFESPLIIEIAILYFGIFLLFKWLRSFLVQTGGSKIKKQVINAMFIVQFILLVLIVIVHLTSPYGKEERPSGMRMDVGYDLVINPVIGLLQLICFVLMCLSLFRHEPVAFKKNWIKYVLIVVIACTLLLAATMIREQFLTHIRGESAGSFFASQDYYFKMDDYSQSLFYSFIPFVFIISLALARREKGDAFKFYPLSVLTVILFFSIDAVISWKFHHFASGEWWYWLKKVGGLG
jgi:hypothetical protein